MIDLEDFTGLSKVMSWISTAAFAGCVMTIEWLFAAVLFCAFAFLTLAFRRPDGRALRTRGSSRVIRWDAPGGR